MKFYFSGTGNSLYMAQKVQESDNRILSIAKLFEDKNDRYEFELRDGEAIGFIFPIYAWAPPKMVLDFIKRIKFKNYKNNYIYFVTTCGANIGNTVGLMKKTLKEVGLDLSSGFSVVMPNNYVIMGNVDSEEEVRDKLNSAGEYINKINSVIDKGEREIFYVKKGPLPRMLTAVINPLFTKNAVSTKGFNVNDNCTGCRICERVCNTKTIVVNGKPAWGNECTGCLACLHSCPVKAINYGKSTIKKGRYINPLINRTDMNLR